MTGWEASVEHVADLFGRAFVVVLLLAGALAIVLGALALANGWRARP